MVRRPKFSLKLLFVGVFVSACALFSARNFASSASVSTTDPYQLVDFLIANGVEQIEGGATMLGHTSYVLSDGMRIRFLKSKLFRHARSNGYNVRVVYECPLWLYNREVQSD
jgi:hypothetical protein